MTVTLSANLLAPAAALIVWSLVMLIWMAQVRFPAMKQAEIDMKAVVGKRGQDLEGVLPARINWPAHNYAHLMEQPTIFYPTVIILAVLGQGDWFNLILAWVYVVLRVVHSLWQVTVNSLPIRMKLFGASSFVLMILAFRALIAAFSG